MIDAYVVLAGRLSYPRSEVLDKLLRGLMDKRGG